MPEYSFSKDKIPKGYSYPLKRSTLDNFITESKLTQVNSVYYNFNLKSDDLVLRGNFFGETIKRPDASLSSIWLWAVSSENRKEIETILINDALPTLMIWLIKAENEGNVWRAKSRYLDFRYRQNEIVVNEW